LIQDFPTPNFEKSKEIRSLYSCVADAVADRAGSSLGVRTSTKKLGLFGCDSLIEIGDTLRKLQRHSVSNGVSKAKKFEYSPENLSGQNVLPFGEIWTSESTGEQEIWA
jgi:hypothetical protein